MRFRLRHALIQVLTILRPARKRWRRAPKHNQIEETVSSPRPIGAMDRDACRLTNRHLDPVTTRVRVVFRSGRTTSGPNRRGGCRPMT